MSTRCALVVAEKHTQLALRTCLEEKALFAARHFCLLCSIEILEWVSGPGATCPPGNALAQLCQFLSLLHLKLPEPKEQDEAGDSNRTKRVTFEAKLMLQCQYNKLPKNVSFCSSFWPFLGLLTFWLDLQNILDFLLFHWRVKADAFVYKPVLNELLVGFIANFIRHWNVILHIRGHGSTG